jgi:hypothetical protein
MQKACERLWSSVLERAIEDFRGFHGLWLQNNAKTWLLSNNDGIGSYLWICGVLNLDPPTVRRSIITSIDEDFSRAESLTINESNVANF